MISSVYLNLYTFPVVLERFFSREERKALFRSWAGSASMWMKVINYLHFNSTYIAHTLWYRVVMPFGVLGLARLMTSAMQPKPTGNWLHSGNQSYLPTTAPEIWLPKSPRIGFLAIHQQHSRQVRTQSTKSNRHLPAWVPRKWFNPIIHMAWNVTRQSWGETTVIIQSGQILWKFGVWLPNLLDHMR